MDDEIEELIRSLRMVDGIGRPIGERPDGEAGTTEPPEDPLLVAALWAEEEESRARDNASLKGGADSGALEVMEDSVTAAPDGAHAVAVSEEDDAFSDTPDRGSGSDDKPDDRPGTGLREDAAARRTGD